jgi:hypothetical protein
MVKVNIDSPTHFRNVLAKLGCGIVSVNVKLDFRHGTKYFGVPCNK